MIDELCGQVTLGGRLGLMLTRATDVAVCLANRTRGVRAVAASDPSTATRAIAAVGMNSLVLDPLGQSLFPIDARHTAVCSRRSANLSSGIDRAFGMRDTVGRFDETDRAHC